MFFSKFRTSIGAHVLKNFVEKFVTVWTRWSLVISFSINRMRLIECVCLARETQCHQTFQDFKSKKPELCKPCFGDAFCCFEGGCMLQFDKLLCVPRVRYHQQFHSSWRQIWLLLHGHHRHYVHGRRYRNCTWWSNQRWMVTMKKTPVFSNFQIHSNYAISWIAEVSLIGPEPIHLRRTKNHFSLCSEFVSAFWQTLIVG